MVTIENEYYLRTILLLCEAGSYIAKLLIGREVPKFRDDLDTLLKNAKGKLQHEFHKRQMEKLFPNDGYDETDVDKWDIQMLVGVLLLLFRSTLSSDEKQKLREIKLIRHEVLAHSPSASLYLEKYEDVSEQLREAIKLLASGFGQEVQDECKNYISIYATHSLDVTSAIKRLQEAKDTDDLFQTVIRVVKEAESSLSKQISEVKDSVREDVKQTVKALTKKFEAIGTEVKSSQQTSSDGFKSVEKNIKETKQTLKKEIDLVEGSVVVTRETLVKKIEKLERAECNTYHALVEMNNEIKLLQQMLTAGPTRHLNSSQPAADLSKTLNLKSEEINKKLQQYDATSSQPCTEESAAVETKSKQLNRSWKDGLPKLLVVAIDFGTTSSGCAFSFKKEYDCDPLKITSVQRGGVTSLISLKIPTTVLFDQNGKLHSFGYEAEDKYSELFLNDEHREWYFFTRFKMVLYSHKVDRSMTLQADNGKSFKAITVFAAAIKFFKDDLLKQTGHLDSCDILWILTVPAIWTDQGKQFMREAAKEAGIEGKNLRIALEPEAASVYCQTVSAETKRPDDSSLACIRSGVKYMVVDIGGGTTDITVIVKQTDGRLVEVYTASGGAWGGTKIDKEIFKLIGRIFGEKIFSEFCREYKEDYLDLQREIETKKRKGVYQRNNSVTLRLPGALQAKCKGIEKAVEEAGFTGKIKFTGDRMHINADTWVELFKSCCDKIINHISDLLSHPAVQDTSVFLLVGGVSSCDIIQNNIKCAFPKINVIIPNEPELAVMKGAVIFGHRRLASMSRVSRYTYGISISPLFDPYIHPETRRVNICGKDRCRDVFMKYISIGENFRVGDARSGEHATLLPYQKEIVLKMYKSSKYNPMLVDEEDTQYLGAVVVHLPNSKEESHATVNMMFGETELIVEATELSQGTKYSARFDFL